MLELRRRLKIKSRGTSKFADSTAFFMVFLRVWSLGKHPEVHLEGQMESKLHPETSLEGQVEFKLALEGTWTAFKCVLECPRGGQERPSTAQEPPKYAPKASKSARRAEKKQSKSTCTANKATLQKVWFS